MSIVEKKSTFENLTLGKKLCNEIFTNICEFAKTTDSTVDLMNYGNNLLMDYSVSYPLNISIGNCVENYTYGDEFINIPNYNHDTDVVKIKFGINVCGLSINFCKFLKNKTTKILYDFLENLESKLVKKMIDKNTTDDFAKFIENTMINKNLILLPNILCNHINQQSDFLPRDFYLNYKGFENEYENICYELEKGSVYNISIKFSLEPVKIIHVKSFLHEKINFIFDKSKSVSNLFKKIKNNKIFSSYNMNSSEKLGLKIMTDKNCIRNLPLLYSKNGIVFTYETTMIVE